VDILSISIEPLLPGLLPSVVVNRSLGTELRILLSWSLYSKSNSNNEFSGLETVVGCGVGLGSCCITSIWKI